MPRNKQNKQYAISEDVKISINAMIKKFLDSMDQNELQFSPSYTSNERAYIHELAKDLGLKSKSKGKGPLRFLTLYKRTGSTIIRRDPIIKLQMSTKQTIFHLMHNFPLNRKEYQDLLPPTERERSSKTYVNTNVKSMGRLNSGVPQIPQLKTNYDLLYFRKCLPVFAAREEILNVLTTNQVVIIAGETGSGKTTQIPQYILEDCQQKQQPCRIICTQPRRLSVVSVAERVAFERNEKIGQTFGYQIRLESRVAPKTLLTYCTNGILLRTLMGGDTALATVSHVIVDEVHERDRFCDFLLIALKDALKKYKSLKVILMSASMDINIFLKYFDNSHVINIMGRSFDVDTYFLEDVLEMTDYMTKEMLIKRQDLLNKKDRRKVLESWTQNKSQHEDKKVTVENSMVPLPLLAPRAEFIPSKVKLEPWLAEEMDKSISDAWLHGGDDHFTQLLHFILSEDVSVNYQHSSTLVTPLMVAAGRGYIHIVNQLINLGAKLNLQACNEWTALDWAKRMNQKECVELIEAHSKTYGDMAQEYEAAQAVKDDSLPEKKKMLLDVYHHTFNDENVDYNLLLHLILFIHLQMPPGSLLIFLPGYDDIVTMRDKINDEERKFNQGLHYNLFVLHSNMQTSDQKKVFKPCPQNVRKIILSTNIAETSITIDDVVYVIDSGKVKEKSFDAISGVCTLRSNWISQACAKQRKGRAGRCREGICFRLFSSMRHNSMQPFQTPEILRLPLQELCLFAKHLASGNAPIAEFLGKALEPPSNMVIRNAIQLLKTIDALNAWEDLTELGSHLLDLPVEPRLGKMLLHAVVLKCLDPVLTIVCSLAYKDPFLLPAQASQKGTVTSVRKKFASNTFSDHLVLLRAFQVWQNARASGIEHSFCGENFISAAVMEMIIGMRTQLLGQLRASGFVKARGPGDIRDLNSNSENWAVVKAALTAGLYPNLIRVDREHSQLRTQKEAKVFFHPSSTLKDFQKSKKAYAQSHAADVETLPSDWLLYEEMSRTGRFCHVKTVTLINPVTVALFSGPARLPIDVTFDADTALDSDSDSEIDEIQKYSMFKLDDWILFRLDSESAELLLYLRRKWNALFLRRMRAPGKPMSQFDEKVVTAIAKVITNEEQACGLQQPSGIGQRPRPLIIDYCPANTKKSGIFSQKKL